MKDKLLYCAVLIILSVLFINCPMIDIEFSRLFFVNNKFFLSEKFFTKLFSGLVFFIVAGLCVWFIYEFITVTRKQKSLHPRKYIHMIYIMSVCVIGAGIIINYGFKDQFQRARPFMVKEFGGDKNFTKAFEITNQCHTNCSFVSGNTSVGAIFFAVGYLYTGKRRKKWFCIAVITSIILGINRISIGRHFLSDVMFSTIIMFTVAYILAKFMQPHNKALISDSRLFYSCLLCEATSIYYLTSLVTQNNILINLTAVLIYMLIAPVILYKVMYNGLGNWGKKS